MSDFRKQSGRDLHSLEELDKRLKTLDETFDNIMQDLANTLQAENLTDCEFSIGSTIRKFGPFVYGYSISMDGKGNPTIREFGNVHLSKEPEDKVKPSLIIDAPDRLIDIINEPNQVRIFAELSGVNKSVIRTKVAKHAVTIRVNSHSRKFLKRLRLPTSVDSASLKTRYNNGCLEITLQKLKTLSNRNRPDI